MGHFRVELHAIPTLLFVGHRGHRDAVGHGGDGEARGHVRDVVTVAHPHIQTRLAAVVGQPAQQRVVALQLHFGMAEFALVGRFRATAQLLGHGLQAVADAEQRQAAVEHFLRCGRCARQRGGFRAAGQDDALGTKGGDFSRIVVPRPDFAIHAKFADATRDQLRVLCAEIEDEDLVVMDVGHKARQVINENGRQCKTDGG
ncbi:hypothetical protein D3C81_854730 [compost metagenome]